jgi:methyltransferase, FkbM family
MEALALRGQSIGVGAGVSGSGETVFLEAFFRANSAQSPLVVFDVGANQGDYTAAVLGIAAGCAECRIVAFEPSEAACEVLTRRYADCHNVTIVKSAVSHQEGRACLHHDQAGSGLSSLYERRLTHLGLELDEMEEVETIDLDTFCAQHAIGSIDLLKLDVEGHELSVLLGAKALLERGGVGVIQFEFGGCNIDSRTYMQDFWYELSPSYDLYRVLRHGLWPVHKYQERLERFVTTNYVAVRRGAGVRR